MTDVTPFIEHVPKDPAGNLAWRVRMRELALKDRDVQRCLFDAAMDDVLFWFNGFCWAYDPRAVEKVVPFVTYPNQDPVIVGVDEAIGDSERSEEPVDVPMPKSRAQGGTYICLNVIARRMIRDGMFTVGLVTRNEKLVDSQIDSDTLMWKLCWLLDQLPFWMLPEGYQRNLSEHTVYIPRTKASAVGFASGADTGRGGRRTVFMVDEFGSPEFQVSGKDYKLLDSLRMVTNCILMPSTFGSDSGAFYEAADDPGNGRILRLDWKDNPKHNRLSYVIRQGVCVAREPADQPAVSEYARVNKDRLSRLERRGFIKDGQVRAPWYDNQCLRPGTTPRGIARELDMDPRGAVGKVFDVDVLARMVKEHCKPPVWQGKLVFDNETLEVKGLIQQENGPLKLWFRPGIDHSPPHGSYVTGHDIAAGGTGDYSSNSTICGIDKRSGEQVLEFAAMGWMATKFARLSIAVARWLNNAFMVWESSGASGSTFGKEVLEVVCYGNVYYRDVDEVGSRAKTRKAGWHNGSDEDKGELFESMGIAFEEGAFIPRSEDMIRESGEYEWDNGKIVHRPSKNLKMDGKAHGDRCIAAGVAWLGCKDQPHTAIDNLSELEQNPPYGSLAWLHAREARTKLRLKNSFLRPSLMDVLGG